MTNPLDHHFLTGLYKLPYAQVYTKGFTSPILEVEERVESWVQDRVQWRVRMMLWHHGIDWTPG